MPNTGSMQRAGKISVTRRLFAISLVFAFLAGVVPMWILAYSRAAERDASARKVQLLQLNDDIAAAGLRARRGEYEPARKYASEFFTQLRSAIDGGDALNQRQRDMLRPLLTQRDDVITLLARNDPAAVDRLFGIEYQRRQDLASRQ